MTFITKSGYTQLKNGYIEDKSPIHSGPIVKKFYAVLVIVGFLLFKSESPQRVVILAKLPPPLWEFFPNTTFFFKMSFPLTLLGPAFENYMDGGGWGGGSYAPPLPATSKCTKNIFLNILLQLNIFWSFMQKIKLLAFKLSTQGAIQNVYLFQKI